MKPVECNALVLKSHATHQRAVGEKRDVHSREGKQGVHDIRCGCPDLQQPIQGLAFREY